VEERETLRARLAQAEQGDRLETARANARSARESCDALLDDAMDAFAVDFLVEDVETEYHGRPRTDLLTRASALLEEFTSCAFRLAPPAPQDERSRARGFRVIAEPNGVAREPEVLSSATFAQLELALRISLLEHVEGAGERLPLFVDEVLTHSDPVRFGAVAVALARLVAAGRQVVFLTSDPADAERFAAAARPSGVTVDVRTIDGSTPEPASPALLALDASPEPPAPAGRSATEYAAALGVPAPDPFLPVDALHPFHLFADHLDVVHALACARLTTIGAVRSFARRGGELPLVVRGCLDERRRAAEALFAAHRVGRAPMVPDQTIAEALGGSSKLAEVIEASERVGRDGRALLRALERREVKNLRSEAIHTLERHLETAGYLADGDPLHGEALVERALDGLGDGTLDARTRLVPMVARLADAISRRSGGTVAAR
jgi:DNA repair protein SbcC/Rad50